MEEVYTCQCGYQLWTIKAEGIQCGSCDAVYGVGWLSPHDFNQRRERGDTAT